MTRILPAKANFEQQRKRAKTLLKQQVADDPACCEILRYHERFSNSPDAQILSADIALSDAQHALARSYGLKNWRSLKHTLQESAGSGKVRRENNRTWIEGVPDGRFGFQWDMLVNAMQTLLAFRGVKASRQDVMACSGDAFNLCHASNWQGTGYLAVPVDTVAGIAKAYGFEYECINDGYAAERLNKLSHAEQLEITQIALDRIWAEIDAGRPALVGGTEAHCGSWTIAAGYDRENMEMCHIGDETPYRWTKIRGVTPGSVDEEFGHMDGRFRGAVRNDGFVGGWQCNPAFLIKQKKSRKLPEQEKVQFVLQQAAKLHHAAKSSIWWWGNVDYFFGKEAYQQWSNALLHLDYPADLDKEKPEDAYDWYDMGNMDTQVDQIVKGRSAAAAFCEKASSVLPDSRQQLRNAARHYRLEVDIAKSAFAPFTPATWPARDESRINWLSDETRRTEGAHAVQAMLEQEQQAISQIEKVLQTGKPEDSHE